MQNPQTVLDPLKVDKSVKGDAWDAFNNAKDENDFKSRMDKINIPKESKAALWDMKFGANRQIPGLSDGLQAPAGDPFNDMIKSEHLRSRPTEEARRLLTARSRYFAGLSNTEQNKILAKLPGPKDAKTNPTEDKIVEGMKHAMLGTFVEFPSQVYHAATDKPTAYEIERHQKHPNLFGDPRQRTISTQMIDRLVVDQMEKEHQKAMKAQKEGRISEALGHHGASALPGIGPAAAYFGENIGEGKFAETFGEVGTYALLGALGRKVTRGIAPEKYMSSAIGGGYKDIEVVSRDLAETATRTGRPTTVGELFDVVQQTGRSLESDFNILLQPIAGQRRLPVEVVRALLNKANEPHLLKTAEGRATRALLRQKAADYMRDWSLAELNQQRMTLYNARVEGKTAAGQMQAIRSSDEVMANQLIEDALRDIVYDDVSRHYGSSVNVRLLKEKQSRILDLQDRLDNQVEVLADAQAQFEAASLPEKLGLSLSGHASGVTPRVHGLLKSLKGGPEKAANAQVRKGFPAGLRDVTSNIGRRDLALQAARKTARQAVRNYPIAALSQAPAQAEERERIEKKKQARKHARELTPLQ